METRQLRVQALFKRSITEPWTVSYVAPSGKMIRASIAATDGGASVGPRLNGVLSSIESKVDYYPFQYAWDDFLNGTLNLFNARMNGDQLIHLEIGLQLRTVLMNVGPDDHVNTGIVDMLGTGTSVITTSEFKTMDTAVTPDSNPVFDLENNSDWFIVGRLADPKIDVDANGNPLTGAVIDGDTIDNFMVLAVGKKVQQAVPQFTVGGKQGTGSLADPTIGQVEQGQDISTPYKYDPVITPGTIINVRFEGINAPEIMGHGYNAGVNRDQEYCVTYGVSTQDALKVGDEAWHFAAQILDPSKPGLIVLNADSQTYQGDDGQEHEILNRDIYNRVTAAVYKTSLTDPTAFFTGTPLYAENVCKTELVTKSKQVMGTINGEQVAPPLAIPYYGFMTPDKIGRINTVQWLSDLNLPIPASVLPAGLSDYGLGDLIKAENKKLAAMNASSNEPATEPTDGFMTEEIKMTDTYNNQIDFISPDDDRVGNVPNSVFPIDSQGNLLVTDRVRIGDVAFVIPPLSIELNSTSSVTKIQTLRTRQSMKIKAGASTNILTLQLYFHDLDSINGYKVPMSKDHPELNRNYYMDGLRPLIAQFKKAPFLPIDNEYINNTLNIHEVALVNLSVQTVPGFPHSLTATLTLAQFDIDAFMPQLPRLGDAINYPLLRWFYQEAMRDDLSESEKDPTKTWLDPIPDGGLTSDVVFQMVNEQDLQDRKQALQSLRYMDDPQTAKDKFNNPTNALNPAEGVLNPMQMQTAVAKPGTLDDGTKNPLDSNNADNTLLGRMYADGWAAQHVLNMYNNYAAARMDTAIDWTKFNNADTIAKNGTAYNGTMIATDEHTIDKDGLSLFKVIYGDISDEKLLGESHFAGVETWAYIKDRETIVANMGDSAADDFDKNGAIKIRLYEQASINKLPKQYQKTGIKDGDFTDFIIPGENIKCIQDILQLGKDAEKRYVQNIEDYENTKNVLDETEAGFNLYDYDIPGLICTGLQVAYENQFSQAQLLELGNPTFQFLGGQDPFIQLNFTADEDAISKLKFMASETERYSRTYRTGITSGFLGLKNDLMGLFGIKTVMIENLVYRTMPGFPGHFEVVMNLCGFDKTQKRIEGLNGISPVDGTPVKSTREASNYNPAVDQAIIDYKMKFMEVYPDLELPTYDDLNAALPYITSEISLYENRTGGVYVDPDFYIATPVTVRQMVQAQALTEVKMSMKDIHGVQMTTSSQSPNMLDGTDEMWSMLNNIDGGGPKLNPQFSWSGNATDAQAANANTTTVAFKSADVQKFVADRKNLQTKPTEKQFNDWGLDLTYRDYASFLANAQPSEVAVYEKIYSLIDQYWGTKGKYLFDGTYTDPTDKAYQKITYSNQQDMHDVNYDYVASTNPKYLTNNAASSTNGKLSLSDYKATDSKLPKERLANIIKSMIHVKSQWKQFYGTGSPILDPQGNSAGIMGVPLTSEADSVDEAQRLLWDWNHNMEVGFKFLWEAYKGALDQKDITYDAAPWDWMAFAYSTGSIKVAGATDPNNAFTQYVYATMDAYYNNYAYMYATPSTTVSMDIMAMKNGYNVDQMNLIKGNKFSMATDLVAAGYRKDSMGKTATEKWLDDQPEGDVKKIYEDYMQQKLSNGAYVYNDQGKGSNTGDVYSVSPMGGLIKLDIPGIDTATDVTNAEKTTKDGSLPDWALNFEIYKDYGKYMKAVDTNNLVNEKSAQDIFPRLFIDMIRYDQKFRLVRAFPTFQMFIIDEGRWMTNYKLWDNLYGYNAIQSIDVNKSRKIAADTAVIQMTNVYSNLTSRSMDTAYGDYDYKFWDNLVWGNPNQEILDARKELLDSMYLQTGARIHLRIGYGSSVPDLPVVFNGTITEMDTSEIVQIVAQGDGLELTNVISGDPHDTNANWLSCTEPRDLICKLLTSKGNWLKDVINLTTHDEFFRDNPLGIMHFGTPGAVPPGDVGWFNHDYGEAAQNIYSSNGLNTFSEYLYQDGSEIPWNFSGPIWTWGPQAGDEANIIVPFYNNTTWDIAQTIAYCSPDYIAAVMPFELRSTLFFGKPYWEAAYQYDSRYEYNKKDKSWTRYKDVEHRKPYMQAHMLDTTMDIISNGLKASSEDIYTNVIVNYNGKQTPLIMADWDIRFDKQTTTVVDAQLVHKFIQNKGPDFFTTEQQAIYYGCSALRDFMKDMYKGEVLILGDPTVKPHDICFLKDDINDMHGNFLVKAVTHHFNQEMGFVTSIQPDAVVVNDDKVMLGLTQWVGTMGIDFAAAMIAKKFGARMLRKAIPSHLISDLINKGKDGGKNLAVKTLKNTVSKLPDSDPDVAKFKQLYEQFANASEADKPGLIKEMKDVSSGLSKKVKVLAKGGDLVDEAGKILSKSDAKVIQKAAGVIENSMKAITGGGKVVESLQKVGGFMLEDNPATFIVMTALQMAGESIAEWYRRKKALLQAVMMMPISYQGREYTAGITGHKGMVVGDSMGKYDSFLSGMGFDGKSNDSFIDYFMTGVNWLTGADSIDYSVTDQDMQQMMYNQTK